MRYGGAQALCPPLVCVRENFMPICYWDDTPHPPFLSGESNIDPSDSAEIAIPPWILFRLVFPILPTGGRPCILNRGLPGLSVS